MNKLKSPTKKESLIIKTMIFLGVVSLLNFLYYFLQPEYRGNRILFGMLAITIIFGAFRNIYMWYNYLKISVPETKDLTGNLKVDILTTYFPGEPYQMIVTTLEAITEITYPHTTYLCDEANDPFLKQFCEENGIIHVTRDNRKDAKAGNINNALRKHATGDICVILDPDHIPQPDFLDPILPHFKDPKIGFVQIVQSYYNIRETLVARGAAEQTFQFYGPMMMTLNSYGAVNAIGANCVFRRTALDSIGGHAPGLCEDMHTAMLLYSKGWKSVYLPEVLAKGLAPSNLTNFYKQQLKWSRGTFDLLLKVYPKIFRKLSLRQKIHFGILPLHYLSGIICLLNFLIPILSLFFSVTPWFGNIIDFGFVLLPVAASSILIRTYIQKWVIEKKERGFHLVGGLLHINTWWVYLIGLFYTIIDKKVPYLPTPKQDEFDTNFRIIIPNLVVATLSTSSIVYGLSRDLTPFSLIMSGFALFNAGIMIFGIYMAGRVTNQNRILRANLKDETLSLLAYLKESAIKTANYAFGITRFTALPILLFVLLIGMGSKIRSENEKWNDIKIEYHKKKTGNYLGIFQPENENGLSDLRLIKTLEAEKNTNFDIISFYTAWNNTSENLIPEKEIRATYQKNAIPLLTWEPWSVNMTFSDSLKNSSNKNVFREINNGTYDKYLSDFADELRDLKKPIFLRFAHEFDNPQYPWSQDGKNPAVFIDAWRHVWDIFKLREAQNVIFVWNPWEVENMLEFYPGDKYVDWVGITALNYSKLNSDKTSIPFKELYQPYHDELYWITRKPVMLAEFGSLQMENQDKDWIENAINSFKNFKEISAIVFFNNQLDKNIPGHSNYKESYLKWNTEVAGSNYRRLNFKRPFQTSKEISLNTSQNVYPNPIPINSVKGIRYKKGQVWDNSYYPLTRKNLEKDFKLLQESGFNTIQFAGGNIYDYNILQMATEYGLQAIYEFKINTSLDFLHNSEQIQDLKDQILETAENYEDNHSILAYTFPYDLEKHYNKPLLFKEEVAYLNLITSLSEEIRLKDNSKTLILDLPLNAETIGNLKKFDSLKLPFDSYGLIVNEDRYLQPVLDFARKNNINVFISDIRPATLFENKDELNTQNIVLHNFQDERENAHLTLDGLVDFSGRKTSDLKKVTAFWNDENQHLKDHSIRILKPAIPLRPGHSINYKSLILQNNEWVLPENIKPDSYNIDWYLIKNDLFGNSLGLKKIGSGETVKLKIPENYKSYEILLTANKKGTDYIFSTRSKLYLKAEN